MSRGKATISIDGTPIVSIHYDPESLDFEKELFEVRGKFMENDEFLKLGLLGDLLVSALCGFALENARRTNDE